MKAAKAAQQKRDLAGAVAEYRLAIQADPENADAHAGFISTTQSLVYSKAGLDKAQTTAERRTALYAGREAAGINLAEYYGVLEERHPNNAVVQWALGKVHGEEPERAEAHYRKAISLDPRFARAYLEIGRLAQQADDRPKTLEFYGKASEADPANDYNAYLHATALKPMDRAKFAAAVDELIRRFPKSAWAGRALHELALGAPAKDRVQAYERMQRQFPDVFKDGYNRGLLDAYLSTGAVERGVEFARAQLAALPAGRLQDLWKARVAYAEAVNEARQLQLGGKRRELCEFVDKTLKEQSLDATDSERLHVMWAEAARLDGNVRGAIDRLLDVQAARPTPEVGGLLFQYAIQSGMSHAQVVEEVWARRTKAAQPMADFELARLDTGAKVHLADLRGKVVLVNFWFPT